MDKEDFSDFKNGKVAQQVERKTENLCVTGSTPVFPTKGFMNKDVLKELVDRKLTIKEISIGFNLSSSGIRYWLSKHGLKTFMSDISNKRSWSKENLICAIGNSETIADVLRKLNISVRPGNYRTIKRAIGVYAIDISHFTGKSCSTGKSRGQVHKGRPLSDILVENSDYANGTNLKARLLKEGLLKNKCDICSLESEWMNKPIVMILDHINGIHTDNRQKNLRLLCPNCNSQQSTFCRK